MKLYALVSANFKVTNVLCVLSLLAETCPRLAAITLTGWKEFASDHLVYLADNFPALRRLDLSAITVCITVLVQPCAVAH